MGKLCGDPKIPVALLRILPIVVKELFKLVARNWVYIVKRTYLIVSSFLLIFLFCNSF